MPDWSASMIRTYEYYEVDPNTWMDKKQITTVKTASISRDISAETLGSATIDATESLGECYVRIYLVTIQNGIRERHVLGTFLVQTPSSKFSGKVKDISMDAYTPLIELKENQPPIGYTILEGANIMDNAYLLIREHARAPVVSAKNTKTLDYDFVANTNDTWCSYITDLVSGAKYDLELDEMGRILFAPKQDTASLQPVWTYNDDNSSILYPDFDITHDLYNVPNTVEVIYSNGSDYFYSKAVNDDPNSPTSTVNRGRPITHRVVNPSLNGNATQYQVDEYTTQLLRELSTLEYTATYKHGYCPVRLNDCVRLNYERAGVVNIKARVISQSIKCDVECAVTETAVFTVKLWG